MVRDIVATAIALADREGVDALSMRRVASELGVGTMSLYWYLESKEDLLDLVFDEVFGGVILTDSELTDWRTGMRAIARRTRAVFLDHPWLIGVGAQRPEISPNMLRHIDQSLALVGDLGLDGDAQQSVLRAIDDYIIGHVTRQASNDAARQRAGGGRIWSDAAYAFMERFAAAEHLDHLRRFIDARPGFGRTADDDGGDDMFYRGLEIVLAGVAATYGLAPLTAPPAPGGSPAPPATGPGRRGRTVGAASPPAGT